MRRIKNRERRRVPRVVLRRVITYEEGASPESNHFLGDKGTRGFLLNMSNGGLCFKTKQPLRKRMVLKVNLPVSEISPAAPTLAQVLWVMRDPKREEYRNGLKFII